MKITRTSDDRFLTTEKCVHRCSIAVVSCIDAVNCLLVTEALYQDSTNHVIMIHTGIEGDKCQFFYLRTSCTCTVSTIHYSLLEELYPVGPGILLQQLVPRLGDESHVVLREGHPLLLRTGSPGD